MGFRVRDLQTGEEAPLAERKPRGSGQHGTCFVFDQRGLDLARRALSSVPEGAVLVVDELGPVELRGKGHMPVLRKAVGVKTSHGPDSGGPPTPRSCPPRFPVGQPTPMLLMSKRKDPRRFEGLRLWSMKSHPRRQVPDEKNDRSESSHSLLERMKS